MWPGCSRPSQLDFISFDAAAIDTLSPASVIELARKVGLLVEEEQQFPDLVRVRLKRNYYDA